MKPAKRRAKEAHASTQKAATATPAAAPAPGADSRTTTVSVLLAVITLALFSQVRQFDFILLDDTAYAADNRLVQQGLTAEGIKWAFTGTQVSNWHPVTTLSLLLNSQFFGNGAGAFHAVNLLLHVANVLLLFRLLQRMTGAFWRSALVAALFAWHPLHVEPVVWVSSRKDVLSGLFWLLAIGSYANYAAQPGTGRYGLTLLWFALGLMSKPMVVTLPLVLLLLDYWPLRRTEKTAFTQLLLEKMPFLALTAAGSVVTFLVQKGTGAVTGHLTLWERAGNAVVSYSRYLEKTFWPAKLSVLYPHPGSWPVWRVALAGLLLAGITVWVVRQAQRAPWLATGWLWYLGMLVPVIGLVQVSIHAMADRYSYLPLIGVFIMLVWGVHDALAQNRQRGVIGGLLGAGALAACLMVTMLQLQHWRNSVTLFAHVLSVTQNNGVAEKIYADALVRQGKAPEALAHYAEAVRLHPDDAEYRFTQAYILSEQGKAEEAILQYQEALKLEPKNAKASFNLGNLYFRRNRLGEALEMYTKTVESQPDMADARVNLGSCLFSMGKLEQAATNFQAALRLDPRLENAYCNLGIIHARLGRPVPAIAAFKEALRLRPDFLLALDQLALLLSTGADPKYRNGAEAVKLALRARDLTDGKQAAQLDTLATAYAEAGIFNEAVRTMQAALQLAPQQDSPVVVEAMRQRLQLFQAGIPFHESQ